MLSMEDGNGKFAIGDVNPERWCGYGPDMEDLWKGGKLDEQA